MDKPLTEQELSELREWLEIGDPIKGKRGQEFLQELASEMDAMPKKELIAHHLVNEEGSCCTVGVIYKARGIDPSKVDAYEPGEVGKQVGISMAMTAEIEYWNDEGGREDETPGERWKRMRKWVSRNLESDPVSGEK